LRDRPDLGAFVRARLADACRVPLEGLCPDTSLIELDLDSLTLVAVLTQIEMAYDIELTSEERLAALEARTPAELTDGVRRRLAVERGTPDARLESIPPLKNET
jgi:acyl carrier protein